MGKSGRHKKLNRQEKAKTQLKGVKKLLKAQNVVNPTLKVKRIVIREQLSATDGDDVAITKRHQSLQEILSSLHHHNTNLRKDALAGLLELISEHVSVLRDNLGKVLERIGALTSDLEGSVRKENLKVAAAVFQRVGEDELAPFWELILTHLSCSLTALNPSVRGATLPFFHLLVAHFPNLVTDSAPNILSSLLALISSSSGTSSKGKSHLKVELGELEDRLKVFSLIGAVLELINLKQDAGHDEKEIGDTTMFLGSEPEILTRSEESEEIEIFSSKCVQQENKKYLGLCYNFGNSSQNSNCCSLSEILGQSISISGTNQNSSEFWTKFASGCIGCLTETWIEVGPSSHGQGGALSTSSSSSSVGNKKGGKIRQGDFSNSGSDKRAKELNGANSSSALDSSSVQILDNLVSVLSQLCKNREPEVDLQQQNLNVTSVLKSVCGGELKRHFFRHLPYVSIREGDKGSLTSVNLRLFLLAAQLDLLDAKLSAKLESLIDELISDGVLSSSEVELVLSILSYDVGRKSRRSVSTDFVMSLLTSKAHRRMIAKYLQSATDLGNSDDLQSILIKGLNWEEITPKLFQSFSRISVKWAKLLNNICVRRLGDLIKFKMLLEENIPWFVNQMGPDSSLELWNEVLRLFYYADALPKFKEAFEEKENLPKQLQITISALD